MLPWWCLYTGKVTVKVKTCRVFSNLQYQMCIPTAAMAVHFLTAKSTVNVLHNLLLIRSYNSNLPVIRNYHSNLLQICSKLRSKDYERRVLKSVTRRFFGFFKFKF